VRHRLLWFGIADHPLEPVLGAFGEKLRKQREQRGIALDAISNTTKINLRMLRALEEEQFDQLPGGVFNKGFVRAYARHVGLNEEEAVSDYLIALRESQIQQQAILPDFRFAESESNRIPIPGKSRDRGAEQARRFLDRDKERRHLDRRQQSRPPEDVRNQHHPGKTHIEGPANATRNLGANFAGSVPKPNRQDQQDRNDAPYLRLKERETIQPDGVGLERFTKDRLGQDRLDEDRHSEDRHSEDRREEDRRNEDGSKAGRLSDDLLTNDRLIDDGPSDAAADVAENEDGSEQFLNRADSFLFRQSAPPPAQETMPIPWGKLAAALLLITLVLAVWNSRRRQPTHESQPQAASNQGVPSSPPGSSSATLTSTMKPQSGHAVPPPSSPQVARTSSTTTAASTTASSTIPPPKTVAAAASTTSLSTATKSAPTMTDEDEPEAKPVAHTAQAKSPASFTVVIRAEKTTWVSIIADGQPVTEETLIAPANTSVKASREVIVKVGNAAGVSFLLNGKPTPAEGKDGEVKTYYIDGKTIGSLTPPQT
jgi:cytoskeletal protein RodZ